MFYTIEHRIYFFPIDRFFKLLLNGWQKKILLNFDSITCRSLSIVKKIYASFAKAWAVYEEEPRPQNHPINFHCSGIFKFCIISDNASIIGHCVFNLTSPVVSHYECLIMYYQKINSLARLTVILRYHLVWLKRRQKTI